MAKIREKLKEVKVKDIFELGRGRVISQGEINENLGDYPVYSSQSKNNGEMGRINSYDFDGEYITWTTDGAYAGSVFYRNGKFNCTNVCGTLKAKNDKIDMRFLTYVLGREAKKHVVYCGNPKLMNNIVADIKLSLPPLAEQKKIAGILSKIDEDIEKTDEVIKKTEEMKKSLMQELFTKGIGHKKFEEIKLGNIADIKNGKSNTQDAVSDGEYLFFDRSALVKKSSKFLFDTEAIILPGEGAEFIPKYYKGKFDLHQRAYSIIPNIKVDGVYLYYFLFAKRNLFIKKSVGSTVKSLRLPMIQSIPVLLPPLVEQKRIAEILSKVDKKIDSYKKIKSKLGILKKGLMQDLLE
jgi:restriction endonuclease S subunit